MNRKKGNKSKNIKLDEDLKMTVLSANTANYPKAQIRFENSSDPTYVNWVAKTLLLLSLTLCSKILAEPCTVFKI